MTTFKNMLLEYKAKYEEYEEAEQTLIEKENNLIRVESRFTNIFGTDDIFSELLFRYANGDLTLDQVTNEFLKAVNK